LELFGTDPAFNHANLLLLVAALGVERVEKEECKE
jgi:hypothetical protein